MAKRKINCSLDEIIMEYLKKVKCEKTSKLFGTENSGERDHSKSLKKFIKILKQRETQTLSERENSNVELGFEINFDAFQPEKKVSFLSQHPSIYMLNCDHVNSRFLCINYDLRYY